jgi:hypothetical protein
MIFNPAMYLIFLRSFPGAKNTIHNQKQCRLVVGMDSTFLRYYSFWPHLVSHNTPDKERRTWLYYEANVRRWDTLL